MEESQRAQTVNLALEIPQSRRLEAVEKGGQYRELLREKQIKEGAETSNAGIAVAVALLMFVIGVGAYENKDRIWGNENMTAVEEAGYLSAGNTEQMTDSSEASVDETSSNTTETGYTIPVERVSGEISEEEEKKGE